jgi:hypothetical protein
MKAKEFNELAFRLGCRARLGGRGRQIELQMWLGTYAADGREWVVRIPASQFAQLIQKYPDLH